MTSYQDRQGIWMLYDYDASPYIMEIAIDVVPLARRAAQQAYGRVGFWPFDLAFSDAVKWWEAQDKPHPLEDSIVHFYYIEPVFRPICLEAPRNEWVQFDHSAIGKICPDCQDRIGRTIK